jgi:hypothetical protein
LPWGLPHRGSAFTRESRIAMEIAERHEPAASNQTGSLAHFGRWTIADQPRKLTRLGCALPWKYAGFIRALMIASWPTSLVSAFCRHAYALDVCEPVLRRSRTCSHVARRRLSDLTLQTPRRRPGCGCRAPRQMTCANRRSVYDTRGFSLASDFGGCSASSVKR